MANKPEPHLDGSQTFPPAAAQATSLRLPASEVGISGNLRLPMELISPDGWRRTGPVLGFYFHHGGGYP